MRNIRIVVSFLLLCLGHAMLLAQTLTITGKVVDEEGLEVIGANIRVKGNASVGTITDEEGLEVIGANIRVKGNASVGTITGLDGAYSIRAGAKDVLQFSFIGMATQNVPVKGRTKIDVQLKQDNKMLDEVVVIGYGTSKRSDLTGSVVSVKSDDLMKTPTSDWPVYRLPSQKEVPVPPFPSVCVVVSPLPRVMNLCMSLMVSLVKMEWQSWIQVRLNPLIF